MNRSVTDASIDEVTKRQDLYDNAKRNNQYDERSLKVVGTLKSGSSWTRLEAPKNPHKRLSMKQEDYRNRHQCGGI